MTDTRPLGLKSEPDGCVTTTTRLEQLSEHPSGRNGLVGKQGFHETGHHSRYMLQQGASRSNTDDGGGFGFC